MRQKVRALSSIGRAPVLHSGGKRFESARVHNVKYLALARIMDNGDKIMDNGDKIMGISTIFDELLCKLRLKLSF